MIRDVIIHLAGEQPLMADIRSLPTAQDTALVCTNLRTRSNQRPIFIDASESWFVFPLSHIRFLEVPEAAVQASEGDDVEALVPAVVGEEDELEIDEDFLRRVREA